MIIQTSAFQQLALGLSIATSSYNEGQSLATSFERFQPFLPTVVEDSELSSIVDSYHALTDKSGQLASHATPEHLSTFFYSAALKLKEISAASNREGFSALANSMRKVWRTPRQRVIEVFRSFHERSPEPRGVLEWHEDGSAELVTLNRVNRDLVGRTEKQIPGTDVRIFFPPEVAPRVAEFIRDIATKGNASAEGIIMQRHSGERITVDMLAERIGDTRYAHFSVKNETLRARAMSRADAEALRVKTVADAAAKVAHDANNFLTVIVGYLDILKMKPTRAALEEILPVFIEKTMMLVDMMRRLGRLTHRHLQEDAAGTDLNLISWRQDIGAAANQLLGENSSKLQLNIQLADSRWLVANPADELWRITFNLIKNAIEAMIDSPTMQLSLSSEKVRIPNKAALRQYDPNNRFPDAKHGDYMKISVEDTGPGMTPEDLEQAFQRYVSEKTDENGAPRGVGLGSVMSIVKASGGILVTNSTVGKGTRFDIYLPRTQTPSPTIILPTELYSPGNEVILIADDDEGIRRGYQRILKYYKYTQVIAVGTTDEVLAHVRSRPDITAAIIDWRMPGMSNEELMKELLQTHPDLPLIVCTGGIPDDADMYTQARFVSKPLLGTEFATALREVIDGDKNSDKPNQ